MSKETEPLLAQRLKNVLEVYIHLPSVSQMAYWDKHYSDVPAEIRYTDMAAAHEKLESLKMIESFRKIYEQLPVDIQSCLPIYMTAEEDLRYIQAEEPEYDMTA